MRNLSARGLVLSTLPWLGLTATAAFATPASAASSVASATNAFAWAAQNDPAYQSIEANHAFFLPTLGRDFVFVSGGQLAFLPNGNAKLTGVIARASDPNKRFAVDIDFSDPASANDPSRVGQTPDRSLEDHAYIENGGPVNPADWSFFQRMQGRLRGLADYEGAVVALSNRRLPATQVGIGANGLNVQRGAHCEIAYRALSQPASGDFINPTLRRGRMNLSLSDSLSTCTNEALNDPAVRPQLAGHALTLPGINSEFIFADRGRFVEYADGSAKLLGVVAREDDPTARFQLDVDFFNRLDPGMTEFPPAGSPKLELLGSAYLDQGGPIDPSNWRYYGTMAGTLHGLQSYSGAILTLEGRGPAFQVGIGANGKNTNDGLSGWLRATTLQQPTGGVTFPANSDGDFNIDLDGGCGSCASVAPKDEEVARFSGGHALWIPGLASDFAFEAGGWLYESEDGTARLTGIVSSQSDPQNRWSVDVAFDDLMTPGDPSFPPAGSPKLELQVSAYTSAGGPIDPSLWSYYESFEGRMSGLGAYAGAELELRRRGEAFQVGLGANGKNLNNGASVWIAVTTISQPEDPQLALASSFNGDFNLDLGDCEVCPTGSSPEFRVSRGPTAFHLGSLGTDYEFDAGARFIETDEGTARLTGTIRRRNDSCSAFDVDIELSGGVLPGEASSPPMGSPRLGLRPELYVDGGGTIDPQLWRYYTELSGTLSGVDCFEGARIALDRKGPAFQIGLGANGDNTEVGATAWMMLELISQPDQGPPLNMPGTGQGDIALDFEPCPDEGDDEL